MKGIQIEKDEIKPSVFTGDWLYKKNILRKLFLKFTRINKWA